VGIVSSIIIFATKLIEFRIKVKEINFSYHAEKVFNLDIPNLQHGNDGLIYTCVNTPYQPGTDTNMCVYSNSSFPPVLADEFPQHEVETAI
jgi:hypothetical protein